MEAYLTSINFHYTNHALFRAGLLFYSRLHVPIDLTKLRWTEIDQWMLGHPWPAKVHRPLPAKEEISLDLMTTKSYFGNNPVVYDQLSQRVVDSWATDEETRGFFNLTFEIPLTQSKEPGEPLIEVRVFERMWQIWSTRQGRAIDGKDEYDLALIHQDFFVSDLLWRRHGIVPILNAAELRLRQDLLNLPDIDLWKEQPDSPLKAFFPYRTLHEMLRAAGYRRAVYSMTLREILVPDVAEVPLPELVAFLEKDKARPVARYVAELLDKYGDHIGPNELAQEVATELFRLVKALAPGLKEATIGVLGNLPSPLLVNPVGLLGGFNTLQSVADLKRHYPWIFAIKELTSKNRTG